MVSIVKRATRLDWSFTEESAGASFRGRRKIGSSVTVITLQRVRVVWNRASACTKISWSSRRSHPLPGGRHTNRHTCSEGGYTIMPRPKGNNRATSSETSALAAHTRQSADTNEADNSPHLDDFDMTKMMQDMLDQVRVASACSHSMEGTNASYINVPLPPRVGLTLTPKLLIMFP